MNIPVYPETHVALKSKKGLIVGIANDQSIAWGCAKAFRALGVGMNEMMCAMRSARASHHEGMGRMMGQNWDHRKADREWRMHGEDDEDSGYHEENDQSRRRVTICIEDENGDQYCRYRH